MQVRTATPDDRLDVVRVVDGALLDVEDVGAAVERGDVLVATVDGPGGDGGERVVGAIVLEPRGYDSRGDSGGAHVEAVAVNRSRRDRGVGTALVNAAHDRYGRLTADFRADVRPFWEAVGFAVEERDGRLWGELA